MALMSRQMEVYRMHNNYTAYMKFFSCLQFFLGYSKLGDERTLLSLSTTKVVYANIVIEKFLEQAHFQMRGIPNDKQFHTLCTASYVCARFCNYNSFILYSNILPYLKNCTNSMQSMYTKQGLTIKK